MLFELFDEIQKINDIVEGTYGKKDDLDERFTDWMSVTTQSVDSILKDMNAMLETGEFEPVLENAESLRVICSNISDKICLALKYKQRPLSSIIASFKYLDKEQNKSDSEIVKQYFLNQQIYYPQMLENDGKIDITYFDVVDKDAFNQVFDK